MESKAINWLLEESQPSVRYYTLVTLLDRKNSDLEVKTAYSEIPKKGWAQNILKRQKLGGYWEKEDSLYRPKYTATNWRAIVLSDLGLVRDNSQVKKLAGQFFQKWLDPTKDNIFKDEVCIVGNTARFLTRFGYGDDYRVKKLYKRLVEDQKEDGGWHCFESKKGTLDGWEGLAAFAEIPKQKQTRSIKQSLERGAEFYLERKLFNEGRKKYLPWFRFHYPNHYYYDILVGLDIITKLGYAGDKRLGPALKILKEKRQTDGTWLLDKVHPDPRSYSWGKHNLKYKAKPFALEREGKPSKWITLRALLVLRRVERAV
jgi:hypothetical protein